MSEEHFIAILELAKYEELIERAIEGVKIPTRTDFGPYQSRAWRKLQAQYKRQNPFCELCLLLEKNNKSKNIHHIKPTGFGGEHLDENNLIALCFSCHLIVHSGIRSALWDKFADTMPDEWWEYTLDIYADLEQSIRKIKQRAKVLEKTNPTEAISLYYKAMRKIKRLELALQRDIFAKRYAEFLQMPVFRYVRYPVNRLSLTLEKLGRFEEALKVIESYESGGDQVGLYAGDAEGVKKRKVRLLAKLKKGRR